MNDDRDAIAWNPDWFIWGTMIDCNRTPIVKGIICENTCIQKWSNLLSVAHLVRAQDQLKRCYKTPTFLRMNKCSHTVFCHILSWWFSGFPFGWEFPVFQFFQFCRHNLHTEVFAHKAIMYYNTFEHFATTVSNVYAGCRNHQTKKL